MRLDQGLTLDANTRRKILTKANKAKPNQPGPARPSQTHPNHEIAGLSKPYAEVAQNGPFWTLFKPVV